MGAITTVWTNNQTITNFNNATLAAAGVTGGDINLGSAGYDLVEVQIAVAFGATPDGPVDVEVLGSPDGGTTDDTEPLQSLSIPEQASTTKRVTLKIAGAGFVRVQATNRDTADTVSVSAKYAGRKWNSV